MTTFVLVRHAEKGTDDARDPSLSEAGRARAIRLAQLLSGRPLTAAYATAYRRTLQTAQPAAEAHGVTVTTYDAQMPAAEFASQLRSNHAQGTVLVVGHSNTIPELAAALSATATTEMREDEFDRLYRVSIGRDGKAVLSQDTY
ncbi:MAG: phosphoglycerate mutase family protein [Pseudoxanthomonas sp.]